MQEDGLIYLAYWKLILKYIYINTHMVGKKEMETYRTSREAIKSEIFTE